MVILRLRVLATLLLAMPSLVWAFDMDNLALLHNSGNSQASYRYAAEHFATMAGDPTFDFYYGVAAINTGHASQGVFALERVLGVVPQNHAARLELARGYFILEEYARSRAEFEIVLNAGPADPVRAKINRYMSAIRQQEGRYQTTSTAYAALGLGHSDNINNAPDDINGTTLTLDNPALDDNYAEFAAGGQINTPIAPGRALFGGANLDYFAYADESDFDTGKLHLHGGISVFDDRNRYRLQLRARNFYFDGESYRNTTALLGDWRIRDSQSRRYNFFAQFANIRYPDQDSRDVSSLSAGAGITQNLTGSLSPVVFGSVFAGQDSADDDTATARAAAERSFTGLQAGAQLTLSAKLRMINSAAFVLSRYAEETVLSGASDRKREDDLIIIKSRLIWLIDDTLSLRGGLQYTDNSSNIDALEYDGLAVDIRLRYDIH